MKQPIVITAIAAIIAAAAMHLFAALTATADITFFVYAPLVMANGNGTVSTPTPTPVDPAAMRAEVITAVNAERAKAGCAAVVEDATLMAAAQAWTDYMVAHTILAHSSDVDYEWYPNHGYTATDWVSENIAGGQDTGAEAVADWMDDAGHRAVVLQSCANTSGTFQVGVGWQFHTWTLAIGELHN